MSQSSQFALLGQRRFLPFFITQLLGALNDNIFKQSLILSILYSLTVAGDRNVLVNLCALLFILPFLLFSALGGQIGEKYNKDALMRGLKLAEVFIMLVGAAGFLISSLPLMLAALFAMGTHSALFGPVKYSILPQHLKSAELVGGNGLVEMGTFLAILAGTIGAAVLSAYGPRTVAIAVVLVACGGYLASRHIPLAPAAMRDLPLDWNIFRQSWQIMRIGLAQRPAISRSLVGTSWFWFLGAVYLTQIPSYAKEWLHGDGSVVTLILMVFSVGIALGSMLCEKLSGHKEEIGLVPLGSIGLTVFSLLLWWSSSSLPAPVQAELYNWSSILGMGQAWKVLSAILGIGIFGGFYIVPLYVLIQSRTAEEQRARVIAANNILNALFMVMAALMSMLVLSVLQLSIPQLFLVLAVLNSLVNLYIFKIVPEFTMRFLIWMLTHFMYRISSRNLTVIPDEGPVVLVCNHVSFVDALLIAGTVRRPVRFVIDRWILRIPVMRFFFRTLGAVPIVPRHEDEQAYEQAFQRIARYLQDGEVVCIFPEGKITADGAINEFKGGIERVIRETPVPVVPMALQGLWGSFFSRNPVKGFFSRFWSRVRLVAGPPVPPEQANRALLQEQVSLLRGDAR